MGAFIWGLFDVSFVRVELVSYTILDLLTCERCVKQAGPLKKQTNLCFFFFFLQLSFLPVAPPAVEAVL